MWIIYNAAGEAVQERRSYPSAKHVVKALANGHYAVNSKTGTRIEAAQ